MSDHKLVPDQPRCQRLAELGFPQEGSYFYYVKQRVDGEIACVGNPNQTVSVILCAAPTVTEMVEWWKDVKGEEPLCGWSIIKKCYYAEVSNLTVYYADTLPNAVADAVAWVLEREQEAKL